LACIFTIYFLFVHWRSFLDIFKRVPAILALEDGTVFHGFSIGSEGETIGEVVFNTSMTGYQEILTDPSYKRQIVTLTYPHIGNVGINTEDEESVDTMLSGLVIKDLPRLVSNWRSEEDLSSYLKRKQIVSIAGIDTRKLTRILRTKGAMGGCIVAGDDITEATAIIAAQKFPGLKGMDLAKEVTANESYIWQQGSWNLGEGLPEPNSEFKYHVVAYDYGVKRNWLIEIVKSPWYRHKLQQQKFWR